jgi:hypothetical protein
MTQPENTPNPELAALRARRAQLEAERVELLEPSDDEQIEIEKRRIADAEAINALIQERGAPGVKWEVIETSLGKVAVSRCSAMRYKKFQDVADFSSEKIEQLVRPNVIYPALPVFDAMNEDQPMIATRCANAMSRMAGVRKEDVEKK